MPEKFNLLCSKQFVVRGKRSTVEAITDIFERLRTNNINKLKSICKFLDFKKAFETLDHKLLLQKFSKYSLRALMLAILQDYFSNRTQFVIPAAKKSDLQKIDTGVSQRTLLGTNLILIYITDLQKHFQRFK